MSNLLNKAIVLSLNANWERLGYMTVGQAIIALTGGLDTPPALAMHIDLDTNPIALLPVTWEEWVKLPVRDCDLALNTTRGAIRCPLVMVEPNFKKMPSREPKLSNEAILERDGYIDQYTLEKLQPHEANVDHVIPRDVWRKRGLKGSPDNWTNMVCCKKERNFKKGNKLNAHAGLVLQRRPKAPKRVPLSFLVREVKHPHHQPFIT
jgi:hypothetical protein